MRISYAGVAIAALFPLASVYAQVIASLPQCVQQCIDQSSDEERCLIDIKCLCQDSDGVLRDVVNCMRQECDISFDINVLLLPLQAACELAGVSISPIVLGNADGRPSSLAARPTVTLTGNITNIAPSSTGPRTAMCTPADTMSQTTSDSAGNVKTMTTTEIQTQLSSFNTGERSGPTTRSARSAASISSLGDTTATTTEAAGTAVSFTMSPSKTAQTDSAQSPDSAPFQMQGAAAKVTSNWIGMAALVWGLSVFLSLANT
jgi:CFEM domain